MTSRTRAALEAAHAASPWQSVYSPAAVTTCVAGGGGGGGGGCGRGGAARAPATTMSRGRLVARLSRLANLRVREPDVTIARLRRPVRRTRLVTSKVTRVRAAHPRADAAGRARTTGCRRHVTPRQCRCRRTRARRPWPRRTLVFVRSHQPRPTTPRTSVALVKPRVSAYRLRVAERTAVCLGSRTAKRRIDRRARDPPRTLRRCARPWFFAGASRRTVASASGVIVIVVAAARAGATGAGPRARRGPRRARDRRGADTPAAAATVGGPLRRSRPPPDRHPVDLDVRDRRVRRRRRRHLGL